MGSGCVFSANCIVWRCVPGWWGGAMHAFSGCALPGAKCASGCQTCLRISGGAYHTRSQACTSMVVKGALCAFRGCAWGQVCHWLCKRAALLCTVWSCAAAIRILVNCVCKAAVMTHGVPSACAVCVSCQVCLCRAAVHVWQVILRHCCCLTIIVQPETQVSILRTSVVALAWANYLV
jgi:hypothetical protein